MARISDRFDLLILDAEQLREHPCRYTLRTMVNEAFYEHHRHIITGNIQDRFETIEDMFRAFGRHGRCAVMFQKKEGVPLQQQDTPVATAMIKWFKESIPGLEDLPSNQQSDEVKKEEKEPLDILAVEMWEPTAVAVRGDPELRGQGLATECLAKLQEDLCSRIVQAELTESKRRNGNVRQPRVDILLRLRTTMEVNGPYWERRGYIPVSTLDFILPTSFVLGICKIPSRQLLKRPAYPSFQHDRSTKKKHKNPQLEALPRSCVILRNGNEMNNNLKPPFPRPNAPEQLDQPRAEDETQNQQRAVSPPLLDPVGSLPTIARTRPESQKNGSGKHLRLRVYFVDESTVEEFVNRDLDVSRLDRIYGYLWMAGRPFNARPLLRLKMMNLEVLVTDQADLHLLKFSNKIFLKPLPDYILDYDFWVEYLCKTQALHEAACGFCLSYIWLISSPHDLRLAKDLHLIPEGVKWHWWKQFVKDFHNNVDLNALDKVSIRYHFGELRLGRINTIYRTRYFWSHFIRGYLYGYNRYEIFFERNFGWLVVAFVYVSVILSAMQVGAELPPLNKSDTFQKASYGFVVFSIVTVVVFLAVVLVVFAWIYFYNMFAAIWHFRQERRNLKKIARQNKDKGA
ncbi:hypothetical protein FQN57_006456 [Myotisia sp. PD_48]|nr:hypothetical protein FQN57_006456 [Myotisia sp. PD_48]